jgi:protein ImuA
MASRIATLRRLAERIREIETQERPHWPASIPLAIAGLERFFPEQRLPGGTLVELLSAHEGVGVWSLALALARRAYLNGKALLIADVRHSFYPPAALRWGIDLERTLILRPRSPREALSATTQALRCSAVGAVIGRFDQIPSADFRRLQLAAEAGGGLGLLLRPAAARRAPSFAAARLLIAPVCSIGAAPKETALKGAAHEVSGPPRAKSVVYSLRGSNAGARGRLLELELLRYRGGQAGQKLLLEINDETGSLHLPAPLAPATPRTRPAASS